MERTYCIRAITSQYFFPLCLSPTRKIAKHSYSSQARVASVVSDNDLVPLLASCLKNNSDQSLQQLTCLLHKPSERLRSRPARSPKVTSSQNDPIYSTIANTHMLYRLLDDSRRISKISAQAKQTLDLLSRPSRWYQQGCSHSPVRVL